MAMNNTVFEIEEQRMQSTKLHNRMCKRSKLQGAFLYIYIFKYYGRLHRNLTDTESG